MTLFGLQRNHLQIFSILCLNLLTVLVGADFKWYNKIFEHDDSSWIDLRSSNYSSMNVKSDVLSTVYLSFSRRNLTFEFPFYSEKIKTVSVTTQGFISMKGKIYSAPFETQYVSPLMANFSPRDTDPKQDIRIHQDDEMFIVQWSTMLLAEEESSDGYFTFQVQLHKDGTIKFVYKEVPISVGKIIDLTHPVIVGLSGAYKYTQDDGTSMYEAIDTIHLNKNKIASGTTYTFKPQPSCLEEKSSCKRCKERSEHCHWCPTLQRCSTGKDYLKPSWDANSCILLSRSECAEDLDVIQTFDPTSPPPHSNDSDVSTVKYTTPPRKQDSTNNDMVVIKALLISTGAIVLLLILATILVRRYRWRSTAFMSHAKLENKGCSCSEDINHTLIKVEDSST